jgi:uncharacterized membrane protein (UPF0127 family)
VKNANPVSWTWQARLLIGMALLLAGCTRSEPETAAPPKTVEDYFVINVGDRPVRMQLAVSEPEMQRGLMHRRELGRDDGMLFVYLRGTPLSFWMRNTSLPLDIGYFTPTGELAEIYPLYPYDETRVSSRGSNLQFALETNQGWFRDNEVRLGAKLDLKALAAALRARGIAPKQFGLE